MNKNITLPCVAEGIPQPTYGWTLPNGTTINASTPVYEFEVGAADDDLSVNRRVKKVLPDGSLLVSKARVGDSGEYTCIAKNHLGVDKRSTKFIVRKGKKLFGILGKDCFDLLYRPIIITMTPLTLPGLGGGGTQSAPPELFSLNFLCNGERHWNQ